ncbi:MAG: hypothetical protein OXI24_19405, partial [Candidatus Poribacteria bacterium]|nr:hypothetical protein [Candidatus Poribacteria bacterium]
PRGITSANNRLYVVDSDKKVYVYDVSLHGKDNRPAFAVAPEHFSISGLTFANDRIYVASQGGSIGGVSSPGDDKVYAYLLSGQRDPNADFGLDHNTPSGLTHANNRIYVIDSGNLSGFQKVYAYLLSGQRDPNADFDLARRATLKNSRAVSYANDRFYMYDRSWEWKGGGPATLLAYLSSGQRDSTADVTLEPLTPNPENFSSLRDDVGAALGLTYTNGRFYVIHPDRPSTVLAYLSSGQRDSAADFGLAVDVGLERPSSNMQPIAMTAVNDTLFYVLDTDRRVYVYTVKAPPIPTIEGFDLVDDNNNPLGITYANNRFYVVEDAEDTQEAKVYAYSFDGKHDPAASFDLPEENRNPMGIAFANDRFYVTATLDRVYAYSSSGERDSTADVFIHNHNYLLSGITYAYDRLYLIIDPRNIPNKPDIAKVYAYSFDGKHDPAASFVLFDQNKENRIPIGITYANDRFYVTTISISAGSGPETYAYSRDGKRDPAADFHLTKNNFFPIGITYANDRFYVVDIQKKRVYSYPSSKQ